MTFETVSDIFTDAAEKLEDLFDQIVGIVYDADATESEKAAARKISEILFRAQQAFPEEEDAVYYEDMLDLIHN